MLEHLRSHSQKKLLALPIFGPTPSSLQGKYHFRVPLVARLLENGETAFSHENDFSMAARIRNSTLPPAINRKNATYFV
jgi:hypothetical protein